MRALPQVALPKWHDVPRCRFGASRPGRSPTAHGATVKVFERDYPPAILALLDRIALDLLAGSVKRCGHESEPGPPTVLGARPNVLQCTTCADEAERSHYPVGVCDTCCNPGIANAFAAVIARSSHCILRLNVCAACLHGIRLEGS